MKFDIIHKEALAQVDGHLVVANHPTLLDVVLLISELPQADCVIKKELFGNFFLRWIVQWAGYIPNDGGAFIVHEAVERVRRGRTVIIFPEGTRSGRSGLIPFSQGFAHIAVRAPCSIVPIYIRCRPGALTKTDGLFSVPPRRAHLTAHVGVPVTPADLYLDSDSVPVAVRKVTAALAHYFQEKVDHDTPERPGR